MSCHSVATAGFAKAVVGEYERGRPDYREEDILELLSNCGALRSATLGAGGFFPAEPILELACGTGKFTRPLVRTLERLGGPGSRANVTLVDPAGMGQHAALQFSGLPFQRTTAHDLAHLADGSIRAVVAAQAFHWFADAASLAEIRRVLCDDGVLVMVWNTRDRTASPLMTDLERLLDESYVTAAVVSGPTPRHNTGEWRAVFSTASAQSSWHPLQESRTLRPYTGSSDQFVDWMLSISVVSLRDADAKADIAARTRALLSAHDEARVTATLDTVRKSPSASSTFESVYTVPLFLDVAWSKVKKRKLETSTSDPGLL